MKTRVLIAGGGLSGLCVARHLADNNISFQLVEARSRLGGRIRVEPAISQSVKVDEFVPSVDLGPSWFWPGQSCLSQLIDDLNVSDSVYAQASEGLSVVEYGNGDLQKTPGAASMAGSYRLDGGMQRLIDELVLQTGNRGDITTQARLVSLAKTSKGVTSQVAVEGKHHDTETELVILAIPPRVVAQSIVLEPALTSVTDGSLATIPTWMAAHAKLVVLYDKPFWQSDGLSGDAFSQIGPLVEIHDASPRQSDRYALFGFVGVEPAQRNNRAEELKTMAIAQLVRLFGPEAADPQRIYLEDWAQEPFTCTELDLTPGGKPPSGEPLPTTEWDSRVLWAGTETATPGAHSNGYLEGAVEAGLRAADLAIDRLN